MFKVSFGDFGRGLFMAIIAPVMVAFFAVLNRVVLDPTFDVFSVDVISLVKELTNVFIVTAYGAFSGYMIKNLFTTDDGRLLGMGSPKE